jgi:competence protein ComFC
MPLLPPHPQPLPWLYPPACPACDLLVAASGATAEPYSLCPPCADQAMPVRPPFCQTCGEPYPGADESLSCPHCQEQALHFEFAIAPFLSSGPIRSAIHRFKYQRHLSLRIPIALWICSLFDSDPRLASAQGPWHLVPVPLHRSRLHRRGFNQSLELCHVIARQRGLPILQPLKRARPTSQQAKLDRSSRFANALDAFTLHPRFLRLPEALDQANIFLVDDIFTTGATTNACAHVLRQAGASRVIVLTAGRS